MKINGKRILFIAPSLFGIPEKIRDKLKELGANVDYFDERPGNSFLIKALIRINKKLIGRYIHNYHKSIIEETKDNQYDFIFFIKGESFSEQDLKYLLGLHPESKSIVYHWDSIQNNPNALNLLDSFDYKFSFDKRDCEKLGLEFLPLFYYDEYSNTCIQIKDGGYDLMFVGTVHSDRYRIITDIINQMVEKRKRVYSYFFFQGKIMFYKYLITHKECRNIEKSSVHYSPIKEDKLLDLYNTSRIIVDINHPKQTGLTLRCIETLGARRKLVTTNQDIVNYDFYNPNNILVIDRNNPHIPNSFIEGRYETVPLDIYTKYSLTTWCSNIFH